MATCCLGLVLPLLAAYGSRVFAADVIPHTLDESALLQMSADAVDMRDLMDADTEQGGLPADSLGRTKSFLDRVTKTRNQAKVEAKQDAELMSETVKNLTRTAMEDMQASVKRAIERPLTGYNKRVDQQRRGLLKAGRRTMTGVEKWTNENIKHHGLSYKFMRWIQQQQDKIDKKVKKFMRENIDWEWLAQSTLMTVSSHTGLKTTGEAQPHITDALEFLDSQDGASEVRSKVQEWMKEGGGERTMADFMRFIGDMSEKAANSTNKWFDSSMHLQKLAAGSLSALAGEGRTGDNASETHPAGPIHPDFPEDLAEVMAGAAEELEKLESMEEPTVSAPTADVQTWMTKYIKPGSQLSTTASEIKHLGDKTAAAASEWFYKNMERQKALGGSLNLLAHYTEEAKGPEDEASKAAREVGRKVLQLFSDGADGNATEATNSMHPDIKDHGENAARMAHWWLETMMEWQKLATGALAKVAAEAREG